MRIKKAMSLTFGDAYRDPRLHGDVGERKDSSTNSRKSRLAVDFNLFKNGQYLTTTEAQDLEYWESIGGTWGGTLQ